MVESGRLPAKGRIRASIEKLSRRVPKKGRKIVTPPSPDRASMFSMCFPEEVPDYDLPMDLGYGTDEMDMIGIGRIFDAAPHGPHTVFNMFGVFVLETDEDDSIPDAYTNDMDFIGIGRILDAAPHGPFLLLTYLEFPYLMMSRSLMSLLLILLMLRERPTLWTHFFLLTLCPGLSPALMIFLMVIMI